jgi:two-component system, NarL family, response regulator NreC
LEVSVLIRLVLVDNAAIVRAGLRLLLEAEDGISVEDEAECAEEAVRMARLHKPDIVLLEPAMPDNDGLDAVPKIKAAAPKATLLMLTMQDDPRVVHEAFARGATGYLLKNAPPSELIAAVREVAAGRQYLYPALGAQMLRAIADSNARAASDPLSAREHQVLRQLAHGHTNQEISRTLSVSVRTVETHRAHIMRKLDLASRAALVHYALEQGLLPIRDTAA